MARLYYTLPSVSQDINAMEALRFPVGNCAMVDPLAYRDVSGCKFPRGDLAL